MNAETQNGSAIAVFKPSRLPYHDAIQERFGIDKAGWKALTEAIYPGAKTADAVIMVLSYCRARRLDPFKRPVHIVPMWDRESGGYVETVWPGIAELRTTAFRTKQYVGCDEAEFGGVKTQAFTGKVKDKKEGWKDKTVTIEFPEWCRMTVYRDQGGHVGKFVGPKVKWLEAYAAIGNSDIPNDMWQSRPDGQLEKCAEAAALRKAFPEELGNELTAEEMEGRKMIVDERQTVHSTKNVDGPPAPDELFKVDGVILNQTAQGVTLRGVKSPEGSQIFVDPRTTPLTPDGAPNAEKSPEDFLKWADGIMAAALYADQLEPLYNDIIEPKSTGIMPPDHAELIALFRKHELRLGIE